MNIMAADDLAMQGVTADTDCLPEILHPSTGFNP